MALFVALFCVILTMYGGGFATIPAYLADMFGTQMVGAIHGRLLTAWSTAGMMGPVIVNYIREYEKSIGVPSDKLYDVTMYVLAGLLVLGLDGELAGAAVGGAVVYETQAAGPPAARRNSFRSPAPLGSDAAASMARHSSPGCSWACRLPGACGSRYPRLPSCSSRRGRRARVPIWAPSHDRWKIYAAFNDAISMTNR